MRSSEREAAAAVARRPGEVALGHLDHLPTLPAIAVRLLELSLRPQTDVRQLAQLIQGDPVITAKLLSLANSAAWAGRDRVRTLEQAITRLGMTTVRNAVFTLKVFECFSARPARAADRAFHPRGLWKHSLACACAAGRIARASQGAGVDPGVAFVAGLLHDLGKIALYYVFPKAYARIISEADRLRCDIADVERSTVGLDHTVAGRRIAQRWGLPRELEETLWLHHVPKDRLPATMACSPLVRIVQLADALVRDQRIGYSGNHTLPDLDQLTAGFIDPAAWQVIESSLAAEVTQLSCLLDMDAETPEQLYLQSVREANRELAQANAELLEANARLAIAARFFAALREFDRLLQDWSAPDAVVVAAAGASRLALSSERVAVLAARPTDQVDIGVGDAGQRSTHTVELSPALQAWLRAAEPADAAPAEPAPPEVLTELARIVDWDSVARSWIIPIQHDGQRAGAIVFASDRDEALALADERDELRSFSASLGLAIGRANAQSAARRLAQDLVETNGRLQAMHAQVLRSRTLSMIAEMASGAGHELNSPLTVISGRAQLLAERVADPDIRKSLDIIHSKAHQASQIVSELMDFARPPKPQAEPVNLADMLEEVRSQVLQQTGLSPAQVTLEHEAARDGVLLTGDPRQLRTVFRELLANAAEAVTANQGRVAIQVRTVEPPAPDGPEDAELPRPASRWVEVAVRDTGVGMPPAVLQRACDPFFSHRPAGRGRGLGLPRAMRFAEAHGGTIQLQSRPGEGTTARVRLPLVDATH